VGADRWGVPRGIPPPQNFVIKGTTEKMVNYIYIIEDGDMGYEDRQAA